MSYMSYDIMMIVLPTCIDYGPLCINRLSSFINSCFKQILNNNKLRKPELPQKNI